MQATALAEIPKIVAKCRERAASRALFPVAKRKELLLQVIKLMKENEAKILAAVKEDLGKCRHEGLLAECYGLISEAYEMLEGIDEWMKPEMVKKPLIMFMETAYIKRDPLGMVLIIGAWNYPIQLVLSPLIGALAAGNTAVIKPSEVSAHSAALMAELIPKYFDSADVAVVNGAVPETTALLQEKFDHIFYTGNSRVARIIMSAAAKHLTPVTLELGGKSPTVVDEGCDLKSAAKRIAWGRFMNAGQTCIAPDYILVKKSIKAKLIDELKAAFDEYLGPNPAESKDYARIINSFHFNRISNLLRGGTVVYGGQTNPATRFFAPTILDNVDLNSELMTEEIFGPLLPVIPIDSMDEAITFVTKRPKPLALYLFSNDSNLVRKFEDEVSCGGMCVNDVIMHIALPTLPFGGVGESGQGAYHGKFSFDTFSHKRSILRRSLGMESLNRIRYPPYSPSQIEKFISYGVLRISPKSNRGRLLGYACVLVGVALLARVLFNKVVS